MHQLELIDQCRLSAAQKIFQTQGNGCFEFSWFLALCTSDEGVLEQVYVHFRSGTAPRRMKQEAATAIASRAVGGKSSGAGDV